MLSCKNLRDFATFKVGGSKQQFDDSKDKTLYCGLMILRGFICLFICMHVSGVQRLI